MGWCGGGGGGVNVKMTNENWETEETMKVRTQECSTRHPFVRKS